ncbi:hypothetical protein GRS96_02340 [Rathayibacter sp. VKM Ac-2803]|uniref:hypothetical protein n=1 Tax=unclassified Rathayibacter TaxID=2609250 RepID=UPI001356BDF5|nr:MULTISPECIES: hypothetical protein [unclassified Rathayibacter]MWV48113.1 hypothetical protein [Rathayibacter sp. VKM Ac-2803]MWV59394.1 hypothetical protein [Rathayibacter sp. VKM Ac-2754]
MTTTNSQTTPTRLVATETKASLKTTEFWAFLLISIAILVAAAVTDNGDDGQGFGADNAWMYVSFVTVGYLVSRGLAKSGTRGIERDDH